MEGLIILAVILYFFNVMAKRAKEVQAAKQRENKADEPAVKARKAAPASPAPNRQPPVKSMQPRMERMPLKTEGNSAYQTMRPTVQAGRVGMAYEGSLGMASKEGAASDEGKDVSDLSLARDRATALHVYDVPDEEASPMDVLPKQWDDHELVQSFVMNEILNRPKRWSRFDG